MTDDPRKTPTDPARPDATPASGTTTTPAPSVHGDAAQDGPAQAGLDELHRQAEEDARDPRGV